MSTQIEYSDLMRGAGVKKDKKLAALAPHSDKVRQSLESGSVDDSLMALHKLGTEVWSQFLFGANSKVESLFKAFSASGELLPEMGKLSLLWPFFDAANVDWKKSMEDEIEDAHRFLIIAKSALCDGRQVYHLSGKSEFGVIEEGTNTEQHVFGGQLFTGGTALVLGKGADIEKKGKDNRRTFFVGSDPDWQVVVPLDPENTGDAQKLAMALKKVAESIADEGSHADGSSGGAAVGADIAGQLQQLVQLRDSGALSEEEFELAKARLLGN